MSRLRSPLARAGHSLRSRAMSQSGTSTAPEVARDLGIDPKRLRDWLRATYPRHEDERHARWQLTPDMVQAARAQFPQR